MIPPKDGDDDLEEFGLGYAARAEVSPSLPAAAPSAPPSTGNVFGYPARGRDSIEDDLIGASGMRALIGSLGAASRGPGSRPSRPVYQESTQLQFPPTTVLPGQSVSITATSAVIMKIQKVLAAESEPGSCIIAGMFFGAVNALTLSNAGLPLSVFSPSGIGNGLPSQIVQPGMNVTVNVTNAGTKPCTVDIVMFGPMLR